MTPSSTFPVWWAKVKRGQEHRDALERYINETLGVETNLPTLAVKFDADTLQHVLYVGQTPDLSEFYSRVGLIFGDCINNFRNALDYLVYEMGVRNTANTGGLQRPNRIKFPICSKKNDWSGIVGGELSEVSQKQQEMIEHFQPYHGRDLEQDASQGLVDHHPLIMLRDLTDFDKHRLLTAIGVPTGNDIAVGPFGAAMMRSGQCQIMHADCGGLPLELGAEIWRARLPDDVSKDEVEMAGHIASLVTLTQAHKQPVIPLIDTLAVMVIKIIRELEPTLKRPVVGPPGVHK